MSHDPRAQDLTAIAGLSLARPVSAYEVSDLSFGSARLERDTERHWGWRRFILSLTPEASADAGRSGSDAPVVEVWPSMVGGLTVQPEALAGLRDLLVTHRLLSHPAWLRSGRADEIPGGSPAARALAALSKQFTERTSEPRHAYLNDECVTCRELRATAERAANEAALKLAEVALRAAKSVAESRRLQQTVQWRKAALAGHGGLARRESSCPHIAMKYEALTALCRRSPELAFEASGLLQVGGALDPPRFVMAAEVFKLAIAHWLLGRARRSYGGWDAPYGRQRFRRTYSASKARAREATALPPEQRAGVTFAANAWGFGGEVGALGWAPAATHEDDVVIDERPSEGEQISVPAMLPEGCLVAPKADAPAVRAPPAKRTRTEAAPAKEAAPPPKRKAAAKAPVASTPAASEAPTGELMASELKAMGHTPADVKRMLADGVLERAGFGWYRFTQRG